MLQAPLNSASGSTCRRGWIRDTEKAMSVAAEGHTPFRQFNPHLKGRTHADGHPGSSGVCLNGAASSGSSSSRSASSWSRITSLSYHPATLCLGFSMLFTLFLCRCLCSSGCCAELELCPLGFAPGAILVLEQSLSPSPGGFQFGSEQEVSIPGDLPDEPAKNFGIEILLFLWNEAHFLLLI